MHCPGRAAGQLGRPLALLLVPFLAKVTLVRAACDLHPVARGILARGLTRLGFLLTPGLGGRFRGCAALFRCPRAGVEPGLLRRLVPEQRGRGQDFGRSPPEPMQLQLVAASQPSDGRDLEEDVVGKGILLWLLGIPLPIIILLLLFWH